MDRVTVLGSINLDHVLRVNKLPKAGETVQAIDVFSNGGGKGANQAIAAKRSGAHTAFIGAVGLDNAGQTMIDLLAKETIDVTQVKCLNDQETGTATILIDDDGENSIVIHAGANAHVTVESYETIELIKDSDCLIAQFEVTLETILRGFEIAQKANVTTILNPAPVVKDIPKKLLQLTDILIPNQTEAELLVGFELNSTERIKEAAEFLLNLGLQLVIITLGSRGVYFLSQTHDGFIAARKVKAVDTTAAGDTFIGAFSATLKKDFSNIKEAISYAIDASSLTVQRLGAQSSIPNKEEIDRLM